MTNGDHRPVNMLRDNHFQLTLLGGIELHEVSGGRATKVSIRPRHLAVLVVLACSTRATRRSRLMAMFWGGEPDGRARHSLSNSLSALRAVLGRDAISATNDDVELSPDLLLAVDAVAFVGACEGRDEARAIAFYSGPLLGEAAIEDADGFALWLTRERSRLESMFATACERRAGVLLRAGHWDECVDIAERWIRAAPSSALAFAALLRAHAGPDSYLACEEALVAYRRTKAWLAEEFDASPDASVVVLADQIAARRDALVPRVEATVVVRTAPRVEPSVSESTPGGAQATETRPASTDAMPATPASETASAHPLVQVPAAPAENPSLALPARRRVPPPWSIAAAILVVAGALAFTGVAVRAASRVPELGGRPFDQHDWVLVADVANTTGDHLFDRSVDVALGAALQENGHLNLFPRSRVMALLQTPDHPISDTAALTESLAREAAERAGVRAVLIPAIARLDRTIVVTARVVDAANGRTVLTETVRAAGGDGVLDAIDDLARRIGSGLGQSRALLVADTIPLPQATTASLDALKRYADALHAWNAGSFTVAISLYTAALAFDSNFALAHAQLGEALAYTDRRAEAEMHFRRALARANLLPERERIAIEAQVAEWRGDRSRAAALLSSYLTGHPTDTEIAEQLSYVYLRLERNRDAIDAYGAVLRVDSLSAPLWINLATAYKMLGHYDSAVMAYRRAFAISPRHRTAGSINNEFGEALAGAGQTDSARANFTLMLSGGPGSRAAGHRSLALLDLLSGDFRSAAAHLRTAVFLRHAAGDDLEEARDNMLLASVLDELGDTRGAHARRDSAYAITDRRSFEPLALLIMGKPAARHHELREARALLDSMRARVNPGSSQDASSAQVMAAEVAIATGRPDDARASLDLALAIDSGGLTLESAAYAAARRGDTAAAYDFYRRLGAHTDRFWEAGIPILLAPYDIAQIADQHGDTARAIAGYTAIVDRWKAGDSSLVPLAESRRRLEALRAPRMPVHGAP